MSPNEGRPAPRWARHGAILGLVALSAIGFLAVREPRSAAPSHLGPGVDILVGLGNGMQELGLVLLTVTVASGYAVASTLLLFALRRRRGAMLWAHGTTAICVLAFLALSSGDDARRVAEENLRQQAQLEAQVLAERQEREAAARAQRDCLRATVRAERPTSVRSTGRPSEPRVEFVLDLSCERNPIARYAWLDAIRLRAEGEGWKLEPFARSFEPALRVVMFEEVPVGGFVWAGTDEALERGRFALEVRFATDGGTEQWIAQPIEGVRVVTRWDP